MRLSIPRANQGQIVEVSYGWNDGDIYRHTLDRSDRSVQIVRLRNAWNHVEPDSREADWLESNDFGGTDSVPAWLDILIDEKGVAVQSLPQD